MKVYRSEFPNPQFERENWLCLNGEWEFEIDNAKVGKEKGYQNRTSLNGKINVPFAPESELSGVGNTDFMYVVWYRKEITLPESMTGKRVFLHFGAVDHEATVYVNGKKAAYHLGGFVPFSVEVTEYGPKFTIVVCAEDDTKSAIGHGKQCPELNSYGCYYTRTTGIWQSVWLEATGERYIENFRVTPMIESSEAVIEVEAKNCYGAEIVAEAFYEGKKQGETRFKMTDGCTVSTIKLAELHLWELGKGRLYDLKLKMIYNGKVTDEVKSYFGMRSVMFDGMKFLLNGKSVFGRFVLDQGFYRDGIFTAPTTDRFIQDIQLSMDMGFNGARLHQKIFEPLALYYCDKMGYMVWDEYPSWGLDCHSFDCVNQYLYEWMDVVKRDYNHPSIIGWCVLNEVWDCDRKRINDEAVKIGYWATKWYDKSRPVIDTSGGFHVVTDTFDVHDYEGDLKKFADKYEKGQFVTFDRVQKYEGQPYLISEYGGIKYIPFGEREQGSWGYGDAAKDEKEFLDRYCGITESIMKNPETWGFCYTQIYDVEQEVNGLYTYDRKCKFSAEGVKRIRECNSAKAAIED
ncbi:MAG: glycoside hydrolase family 2 protein [Candidatus Neoclostridium sp.]